MNGKSNKREEEFSALLELITDSVVIVDMRGTLLDVNKGFEKITRLSREKTIGKNVTEFGFFSEKIITVFRKNLEKRLIGLDVGPYEVKVVAENGKTVNFEVNAKNIDYAGQPAVFAVFRAVARRKRGERQLEAYHEKLEALVDEKTRKIRENEEKLEKILGSSPDAIAVADVDAKISECNQAALDMFGYSSKGEVIGRNLLEFVARSDQQKVAKDFEEILFEQGTAKNIEYTFLAKNGREFLGEISTSSIKDSSGNLTGFVVIIEDITERKQLEEKLRASEEKYRSLFSAMDEGVALHEVIYGELGKAVDYVVVDVNPAYEFFTGIKREDAVGKKASNLYRTDKPPYLDVYAKVAESGEPTTFETYFPPLKRHFSIAVFSPAKGKFATVFADITERKKLEDALRESEEMFRAISTFAVDAIILVDDAGKFAYWNPAAEKMFGYTNEEILNTSTKEAIEALAPREYKEVFSKFLKEPPETIIQSKGKTFNLSVYRKDGTEFPIELSVSILMLDNKPHLLGLVRDVSERKRLEEALRESEEMFRAISASALDAIILIDDAGKVAYWNPAAEKMLGYTKEDIIGKDLSTTIIPSAHREFYSKFRKQPFETTEHFQGTTFTLSALRKDGTEIPIELSVSLLMLENKLHMLGLVRDVSERKKAEEALRQSEKTYKALINGMNDTAWVIDFDAHLIDVNDAAVRVMGYSREELLSMEPTNIDSNLNKEQMKNLARNIPANRLQTFETTHTTKDGREIPVEVSASVVTYQGKPAILSIARDITERKELQSQLAEYSMGLERLVEERTAELKQAQAKLIQSERMAAIGELAGMVGHDLRNPLTAIKNAVYFLNKKHASSADSTEKEMLGIVDNAINHANRIISDLLDYSREMRLEPAECSPRSLLKGAIAMVQIPANIKITDHTLDSPKISADVDKIVRVFTNLIKNAIDAMPNGGTVEIRSAVADGNVNVTFADTGTGISEAVMAKLFTPLFTTKAQGMGFGLSICKRVMEAHGGKITVESAVGKGTTFTVALPLESKLVKGGEK